MAIDFSQDRWDKVKSVYQQWWGGELDRPIIPIVLIGRDPGRPKPDAPFLSQATCHDLSIPVEELINRLDYELSTCVYLGDSFPYFNMDVFGPGVIAAYLGGRLDNASGQVWFYPPSDDIPIQEITFEFDSNNKWFQRTIEIYKAGMERWNGMVLMGMTDIGGNLDVLSSFLPGERLLLDLIDHPDEVKRLLWEAHTAWHQYYAAVNQVLDGVNPGYSDWSSIFSDKPIYMLQSDFSYMIGPKMFDEFVKPELDETCKKLPRSFYHLDGVGQIPHLDSLLEIDELDGVQWVPGDGKPDPGHWPEIHHKIYKAGKKIQIIYGGFNAIDAVIDQIGSAHGLNHGFFYAPINEGAEIRRKLRSYRIEES